MLQAVHTDFQGLILIFFNGLWEFHTQPSDCQLSLLQPIYKGHNKDETDPASYRGMYFNDTLAKLFEDLLISRLTTHTELWDYAQPLNKDLGTADNKLEHFLNGTSGHFYAQQEHTWKGKECQAALDHVLTWNYHLPPQTTKPNPKSHKKFGHCQIWIQLPHLDFPKRTNTARTTQPDFSQRIDTVFFKRHVDDWKVRIKTQIQGD